MEDESIAILRSYLPKSWVVRDYKPDYGIDISIEIFEAVDDTGKVYETLGEFFFAQIKSVNKIAVIETEKYPRHNVERGHRIEMAEDAIRFPVVRFALEVPLINTAIAMGAANPVLLLIVDLQTKEIYFICINDYAEKVLRWEHEGDFHLDKAGSICDRRLITGELLMAAAQLDNPAFQDDSLAREWFEARIWPNGPVCPHCGSFGEGVTKLCGEAHRPGVFQCNACRKQFTVTVGTVEDRAAYLAQGDVPAIGLEERDLDASTASDARCQPQIDVVFDAPHSRGNARAVFRLRHGRARPAGPGR